MSLPSHTSNSSERYTPGYILDAVREVLGTIELDPTSCAEANERVKAEKYYTEATDGLVQDWRGNTFINPPGDARGIKVKQFWKKTAYHASVGEISAIWVGFNVNQLQTLQEFADNPLTHPTCMLNRRIAFEPSKELEAQLRKEAEEKGKKYSNSPAHTNYITLVSQNEEHLKAFMRVFGELGTIVQKVNHE